MSQTTRCPSCHTRFKVVADQLRISDGWVRCGQCNQVFDATHSLEAAPPPAMFPDMNLESLRGPVARAQVTAAPQEAWKMAGPAQASAQRRVDDSADRALRFPSNSPPAPAVPVAPVARFESRGESERLRNESFREESPPDFENTVPAELWSDLEEEKPLFPAAAQPFVAEPRFVAEQPKNSPLESPQVESSAIASYQREVPEAPFPPPRAQPLGMDRLEGVSPAGAMLHRADATAGKLTSASASGTYKRGGYELPGSDTGDEADDWPLFSDTSAQSPKGASAQSSQDGVYRLNEPDAHDAAEPDLAHFIAEFTEQRDSRRPDQGAWQEEAYRTDELSTGRREPTLDPERPIQTGVRFPSEDPVSAADDVQDWHLSSAGSDLSRAGSVLPAATRVPDTGRAELVEPDDGLDIELVDSEWDEEPQARPEPSAVPEPSFVRHARRRAFWSGTTVRAGLWLAALLLAGLLLGQLAVHHRDLLAAGFPQTRAWLVSLCQPLRCVVEPHRDIGAILVDGSSFNRTQGDRYQFLLTLRNQSALAVRAPVIELTLTDVQDQPVVRRVLQADELRLPDVFQPQQEWSGEMPMIMAPGTARIAGYRVLAFYPN